MTFHFAFCVNDQYVDFIRPAIMALKENHKNDTCVVHVVSDRISNKNHKYLCELFNNERFSLQVHILSDSSLKGLKTRHWPVHIWYRVLLANTLEDRIDKVLYLDADTLVLKNLSELFSMDMANKSIAAAIDYQDLFNNVFERCGYEKDKGYICSGVILMNLRYWRENNLSEKILSWARENDDKLRCPDQDAINYICRDSKIILPMRYGIMDCFFTDPLFTDAGYADQIQECRYNPVIVHYNGRTPWYKEYKRHTLHHEWEKFNQMLTKPVKMRYQAKGLLLLKIMAWRFLYARNN